MKGRTVAVVAAIVVVGCLGAGVVVSVGGYVVWRRHASASADPTVTVPQIGVTYQVPRGWVKAVTAATPPESTDESVRTLSSICAVGEMIPGTQTGAEWDALQHGRSDSDPQLRIGHTSVLGRTATVLEGPVWRYTFIPLNDNGRVIYVLAQWWILHPEDRPGAIAGCDEVLASLELI